MVLELQHQSQVWSLSSLILSYLVIGNHNNIFLLATMEISNLIECVFLSLSPSLSLIFLRETSHVMIFIFGCRFSFFSWLISRLVSIRHRLKAMGGMVAVR